MLRSKLNLMAMFNVIVCPPNNNQLFKLKLMSAADNLMGLIIVTPYPDLKDHAILHLYIKLKYRKRWLTKRFGYKIFSKLIELSSDKNIEALHSAALKPESPRLLDFFNFIHYYDNLYKLTINDFK